MTLYVDDITKNGNEPHSGASTPSKGLPFIMENISGGLRPVVLGAVNQVPYRFMIHSNAGLYVQTNHDTATKANIDSLRHVGAYGISSSGQLSDLGRKEGTLPILTVDKKVWHDVPVSVFETTNTDTGMLGLNWIKAAQIVMDFPAQLWYPMMNPSDMAPMAARLLLEGYQKIPMRRDEQTRRYLVDATINGVTRTMVLSTVAGLVLDVDFARAAQVGIGGSSGESGGPTGAVQQRFYLERHIELTIGDWSSQPLQGEVEDVYAYMGDTRPETGASGGMIGLEVLVSHGAVVDFGACQLYMNSKQSLS